MAAFRRFSKNISTIFEKYFENVPKIIFSIFWHFCTRIAILYAWWNFHNHSFFPSYFICKLKMKHLWHIDNELFVLGKSSHIYEFHLGSLVLYMFRLLQTIYHLEGTMDNFFNYEGIFFWQNQKFGIFCHILSSFQIIDCGESFVHCGESSQLKKRNFWFAPWVTATNQSFLFISVTHGVEQEDLVRRRNSRRRTGKYSWTPWLTASNWKI